MEFSPVPSREHAIVWEIRPGEARGALIDFGAEQRIVLRRAWTAGRGEPLPSFLKIKRYRRAPVIVSLHPQLARTFVLPFRIQRKKTDPAVTPEAFQSLLQGFLEKTTFEMRRMAGEALGVEELDAILLDARLMKILVDGAEMREGRPIEGRRVEGFLQAVFTTRAVFHDLHDLLHSRRELFFTERGPAAMSFLSRAGEDPASVLDLEADGGQFLRLDHDADEVVRKMPVKFEAADFPAALAEHWHLSKEAAARAYALFIAGGFSAAASRTARKLFAPLEESFARAVDRATARVKPGKRLYVRSAVPLPFALPVPPAARGGAELSPFPQEEILHRSGVVFDAGPLAGGMGGTVTDPARGTGAAPADASYFLMPFLEYYYHRGDPAAHRALTRHIHWIAP